MRGKRTGKASARVVTNWKRLRSITDHEIRRGLEQDPEAQATDEEFWKSAEVVMPKGKETITIRLDADLLEWFRRKKGYQTHINAVLRSYMRAHTRKSA